MSRFKAYMRALVREGDGPMGVGLEVFRLDSIDPIEDLTAEEAAVAEEEKDQASTTAIMRVYEDIGEDFWSGQGITAKKFADDLDAFGDIKRLNIHINSLGGDVFTAQAINSTLRNHAATKTSYIDGVAASAATIIACAGDQVIARNNTNYMVHEPWGMVMGNAKEMRKAASSLEAVTAPIVNVYHDQVKGKVTDEQISQLMEDETWMTADEALEKGFVDQVRGKISAIARVSKTQIMCSGRLMNFGRYHFRNMPKYPLIKRPPAAAASAQPPQDKQQKQEKGNKAMTLEDITPELRANIEDAARTAERTRLAALDALNGPGLNEIIAKAKAENKQPNDIALECLAVTKGQLSASQATSALARDAAAARAVPAGDAPSRRPAEKPEAKGARFLAEAFKAQKPRGVVASGGSNGH